MENKASNDYVAELLKQLDELKRKKALKERKLQKLKTGSTVDQRKEQTSRITRALFHNTCDQHLYENGSKSVSADDGCHQYGNCSLNASECTKPDSAKGEKYKENCIDNSCVSANVEQLKLKRNSTKNSELDTPTCNKDIHDREYISQTVNSHCPNFQENNCKRLKRNNDIFAVPSTEKSFLHNENGEAKSCLNSNHELLSQDHGSSKTETCHIEVKCKQISIKNELNVEKTESAKEENRKTLPLESEKLDIGEHKDNSSCDRSKTDEKSNKPLSGKEKSCDILNDSLNSNMSCFLSAEFFPADDNTQELVFEDKSHIPEITKQAETSEHVTVVSHSVIPNTVCNKAEQNNLDNFNFPKFSTPTDGINFLSSSDENIKSQSKPAKQNASVVSEVHTLSSTTEYICSVNKTSKDYTDIKNIFDPTQVSVIIGKGLCSVLDAHYVSPNKSSELKGVSSNINSQEIHSQDRVVLKDRLSDKMYEKNSTESSEYDKYIIMADENFECTEELFGESLNCANNSFLNVQSQVTKTVSGLVNKVCEDSVNVMDIKMDIHMGSTSDQNSKADSQTLVIPETEGLDLCNSDNFLDTSTLSENLNDFHTKDNSLNVSSQSKFESPVVNKIISAVKSARESGIFNNSVVTSHPRDVKENGLTDDASIEVEEEKSDYHLDNTSAMETSLLGDDTQELGNYKQVPYMNKNNAECTHRSDNKTESNLNFVCSLQGANNEAVLDVEIVLFGDVKYAFIQHETEVHVWCQAKKKEWIKIFSHAIENMFSLVKICVTKDEENLVIIMLLSNGEQYCLQFLLFEKDVKIIKLMENTHWLEKRHSSECVLLCGLEGLMFASAQPISGHEVSLHAFLSLKESPRLMTAALGSTGSTLYSLCKINSLPNALMGINDSMLYIWHILEARLVTAVTLHPQDYLPIRSCFWATVENGLIYLLTTCKGPEKHLVCQLLAANLATGFCQTAMKFSSQPSGNEVFEISKAVYMEPFLVVSNSKGALMWSITDEHCCAALSSKSGTTTVTISSDYDNWGLIAVGSTQGYVNCYSLN